MRTDLGALAIDENDTAGRYHSLVFHIIYPDRIIVNLRTASIDEVGVDGRRGDDEVGKVLLGQGG